MHSRPKIIFSAIVAILVLVCFKTWKFWSHHQDVDQEAEEHEAVVVQANPRKLRPIPPHQELGKVLRGGKDEEHSWALQTIDQIARERIDLSPEDIKKFMDFIAGEKPTTLVNGEWQHRVNSVLNALRANMQTMIA